MPAAILNAKIEAYLNGLLPTRDTVLTEMEKIARRRDIPIIGPACARVLSLMVRISGARRIFEMGSAIGYSTIWLARAAGPRAEVYYTDSDRLNASRARAYFERAGVERRITIMIGKAQEMLAKTTGKFDMIFIDVNKDQYPSALKQALPRLRVGGLLITDNTLWSGKVARRGRDADTLGVQEFNRRIYASPQLYPIIVPLRDGVAVCQKV